MGDLYHKRFTYVENINIYLYQNSFLEEQASDLYTQNSSYTIICNNYRTLKFKLL